MNYIAIGILIGLGIAVFLTFDVFSRNYDFGGCVVAFLFMAVIFCPLCGLVGHLLDASEEINNTIKTTINTNYDNVVNYHNGIANMSFVSNGTKYTFDYDDETKTLTVFTDTNINVDAVFVDGVKQDKQKTSNKTGKEKDCVSYKTDDTDKTDTANTDETGSKQGTTSSLSSTTSSTATSLQQKIQDKIQSRCSGAVMTGFDTINLSGTFSCDNVQYSFTWKDDMLEIVNANDADDVTYYKITQ